MAGSTVKMVRARLFRERNPAAFGILSVPNPPVLAKVPATITEQEAVRLAQRVLTVGEEEFRAAAALVAVGGAGPGACGSGGLLFLLLLLFLLGERPLAAVEDQRRGDEDQANLFGESVHGSTQPLTTWAAM